MFGSDHLEFSVAGGVARLTFNRPEARNALTRAMYRGVVLACEEVDANPEIDILVIQGVEGVFCSGGDLVEGQTFMEGLEDSARSTASLFGDGPSSYLDVDPILAVQNTRKIVVAAVDGLCMGGGFMTAMTADLCVASERSVFRVPEARMGVIDAWVAARLPLYVGLERAKHAILTCRPISAETAERWGLISAVVAQDEFHEYVDQLIADLTAGSPTAREAYKALANRALPDEEGMSPHYDKASGVFRSEDAREGMSAFKEKRLPVWAQRV